jgi:Fe-S cluster assembly ATP-binding protein
VLELKNISYEVADNGAAGSKEILRGIDLVIEDGSFVVITGPNGGGKSTLAKIIMGIERPSEGQILHNGEDITALSTTERARNGIGFAFQQPVRFKGLSVRDLLNISAGKRLNTEQACGYLSEVGLCALDYVDRELNASLSGGELKRIEIAMVLARGTMLSVFDEPEAGIDLWSFNNLIRVFEKMRDETNGAVVIISHQERILAIANKVVVLAGGRIEAEGSREEILPGLLSGSEESCAFFRQGGTAAG